MSSEPPTSSENSEQPDRTDSDEAPSVLSHVRDLLGFEPGVQLRSLTTGSALSFDEGEEEGKYLIERVIGEGGMGRVFLAFDRDLKRHVALKVVKNQTDQKPEQLARFVEEAQITGQLEHPGIPPVHELAINQDREIFFTLKLLRGRTLKEIIRELHIGRRDTRERFSRIRLLQIIQHVCNAVHFAHEKGVIHRDIKPDNIMVGDYGEVQLMDWGLAKAIGQSDLDDFEDSTGDLQVETLRTEQNLETIAGSIQGTLQYMAPEQAQGRGDLVDRRSDIFALGATLYEALTFLPPKTGGSVKELLEESRLGLIIAPTKRAPKQRIPTELEEICLQALELHPEDRYQTALEFAEAIQVFLDGTLERERRQRESDAFFKDAQRVSRDYEAEKAARERLEHEFHALDESAGNYPDAETKARLRELREARDGKKIELARLYTQAQTLLSAAIAANSANSRARRLLGELYLERFLEADDEKHTADAIFYRGLIEQVNDGSFDRVLKGNGSLRVSTQPPDAELKLFRHEERDAILVAETEVTRGTGVIELENIPMGSYLLVCELADHNVTRVPLLVGRNQVIRRTVHLYEKDEIPERYCLVPSGDFVMFGDPNVLSTFRDRRIVDVGDFAIGRFPVTCGEYLEFLNELLARDPDEARRRCPRESESSGFLWSETEEGFAFPAETRYPWSERLPVFGVSFDDATAYCRHLSEREGREYALPSEPEWEKAARGVDGRHFSWGDHFDNEYANNLYAHADRDAGVDTVDSFPHDESPYGVRGMVGNVSEFCIPVDDERPGMVAVRGGNWALSENPCRLAVRRVTDDRYVSDRLGFRVKFYPR